MTDALDYRPVLQEYAADCQPRRVEFLDSAGGLSGARLWRLTTPRGPLLLRRWAASHPTRDRLEFIQAVLWHVHQEGFDRVPLPLETLAHAGYVPHAGRLWELAPWLPGAADYSIAPSAARRRAALTALAEFHIAASSFPLAEPPLCRSPGIDERLKQIVRLTSGGHERLRAVLAATEQTPAAESQQALAAQLLDFFPRVAPHVHSLLAQAERIEVPMAPCLRDIWSDNILFSGDTVTGLIDFGALRPESVAADVARLIGSLAEDDRAAWKDALAAYEQVRPLWELEAMLLTAFDASGVLLGAMNWVTWLFVERREFADVSLVTARLQYFLRRLTAMAS